MQPHSNLHGKSHNPAIIRHEKALQIKHRILSTYIWHLSVPSTKQPVLIQAFRHPKIPTRHVELVPLKPWSGMSLDAMHSVFASLT